MPTPRKKREKRQSTLSMEEKEIQKIIEVCVKQVGGKLVRMIIAMLYETKQESINQR